jgi:molecular chaperone DnaJ
VPADAGGAEIRAAYRARARVHHPDRSGADPDVMAALNEAYRVLGDPGRRALYDRSLVGSRGPTTGNGAHGNHASAGGVGSPPPPPPVSSGPARVPWKLMAVTAVVGSAIVLAAAAFTDPPADEVPDGILRVGSCIAIEQNGDAREVACTGTSDDVVVELLLPTDARCPMGMAQHRDRLGLGTACVEMDG